MFVPLQFSICSLARRNKYHVRTENPSFKAFIVRFFYLVSKTNRCLTPISALPSSPSLHDYPSIDIDSPIDVDNDESDSALIPSKIALISPSVFEMEIHIFYIDKIRIPSGSVPLTPDQASILTHFLYESHDNEEQLHYALKSIANTSVFKESNENSSFQNQKVRMFYNLGQINLANAGCITRLRELLLISDNDTTKCHILLALNNLALNDFAITQFSVGTHRLSTECRTLICSILEYCFYCYQFMSH